MLSALQVAGRTALALVTVACCAAQLSPQPGIREYADPSDPFPRMLAVRFLVLVNAVRAGDRATAYDMRTADRLSDLADRFPDADQRWEAMKAEILEQPDRYTADKVFYARAIPDQARVAYLTVVPDEETVYVAAYSFAMFRRERGAWRIGRFGGSFTCARCSPPPPAAYYPDEPWLRLPGEQSPNE